ncbi:SDR family NAD(P)-dependent oxidoreductase [Rouxiella badensis]|jgi:NAD(P)-dependent dehydrogenase (short-subunit alcohol dehydrogenase family)|uniref:Short-chain dehydrogenase n=1 Tax=Rouxiella badensis TaxID=1646377 RepID=A0A1X0WKQ6_9GAMM|nr:SDR family NAD(P)-dependent oxidoreductase [Rouxiella badensis]MCC3701034.1 SDR family NAD(P)-dependent oxidoreductase [Rouxiella badensis]MCC3717461.1 SDR family NAD(P)-dependent oxidoreductase [Rouxiella badensis]MCC3727595.1 SDR family NAD(P)-dependent oxidoreductase [Rouxiella badensis]MCC3732461.1 SDR family NAD(P)-dependent oxidoreductase [Rouxiella badensis]MCC3740427.1 SDR family NAD(P)-dependent oxidoreductase [Rouxiella badensis]
MKSVLITGASSGIGKQLALDYAAEGWKVIACGRNAERLEALSAASAQISTLTFDMTDLEETRKALAWVQASLVILCAGTCEYLDNGVVEADKVLRVMTTNLMGPVNCLDALLPGMASGSRIALVGSTAALFPLPRAEAYGASKAALAYFARSLALDLTPRGIAISLVQPGFVKTPLTDNNDFPMPMMITVEKSSAFIRKGLARGASEIAFPPLFAWLLRLLSVLPRGVQKLLAKKLVR